MDAEDSLWYPELMLARLLPYWPLGSRIFALVASYASVLGLAVSLRDPAKPLHGWAYAGLGLSLAFVLVAIVLEFRSVTRQRSFAVGDKRGIRDFMYDWIATGGRVAIWTRDHSWVSDDDMREMLVAKARKGDLVLCVPKETSLTKTLKEVGADVVEYDALRGASAARFTIAHFEQQGAVVAVARPNTKLHVIEFYESGQHAAFDLAADLVRLAKDLTALTAGGANNAARPTGTH